MTEIAEVSIFDTDAAYGLINDLKGSSFDVSFELTEGDSVKDADTLKIHAEEVEPKDLVELAFVITETREQAQFVVDLGYRARDMRSTCINWDSVDKQKLERQIRR